MKTDLASFCCDSEYNTFTSVLCVQVQCVQWHPYEPQLLATGAFDGRVRLFDCMASEVSVTLHVYCHGDIIVRHVVILCRQRNEFGNWMGRSKKCYGIT